MRAFLLLLVAVAGCSGPTSATAPATPTPAAPVPPDIAASPAARDPLAPLPVIRAVAGRPVTLSVADLLGADVTVAVPPAEGPTESRAEVQLLDGGRLVVTAAEAGLHLVPITANGARLALAVQAVRTAEPDASSTLVVRTLGTEPGDPSQLRLEVREVDGRGRPLLPLGLDDEEGIVVLDGNRILDDNAVYFDPGSGELALDLDALDGGRRLLRLAVRDGARFSRWLEIAVQDRRLATPSETDARD